MKTFLQCQLFSITHQRLLYQRWFYRCLSLWLFWCLGFISSLAQDSSSTKLLSPAPFLPLRIGLVGGLARHFPLTSLEGLAGIQPFPVALQEFNSFMPDIGLEASYRISPLLEIALRGQYARTSFDAAANERLPVSVWDPMQGVRVPVLAVIRNVFATDIAMFSATPLLRLYLGDIFFVSAGARFDASFQTSFRYRNVIVEPQNIGFVTIPQGSFDMLLRAPQAIMPLTISPIVSLGAALSVGRTRFIPELQIQPLFQPFRGVTPERTAFVLPTARLNLSIMLGFTENTALQAPKDTGNSNTVNSQFTNNSSQSNSQVTLSPPAVTPSLTAAQVSSFSSNTPSILSKALSADTLIQAAVLVRRDTIFERDTTVRIVAWNEPDTTRLEQKNVQRAIVNGTEQIRIAESFRHDIPKPRPFLVGTLDVRFIPQLGAAKSAESQQTSRLIEKPMIIRSWIAISQSLSNAGYDEVYDTVAAVRMPLVRFVPKISSEAGTASQSIVVTPQINNEVVFTEIYYSGMKPIDWDAQMVIFPDILPHFQARMRSRGYDIAQGQKHLDTLFAWMKLIDNEAQEYHSDTINLTVERSTLERSESSGGVNAEASSFAAAKLQSRWTVVHLPLIWQGDSLKGAYALTPEARLLQQHLQKTISKTGAKIPFKNAMVYATVKGAEFTAESEKASTLRRLIRLIAEPLKAQVQLLTTLPKKNDVFPATDAYIRVLIEE